MLERDVEQYLVKRVKALGGECFKWVSPGRVGVPDRIVVLPGGQIMFIEVKRPGAKPTKLQIHTLQMLGRLGCRANWLDSKEAVDDLFP